MPPTICLLSKTSPPCSGCPNPGSMNAREEEAPTACRSSSWGSMSALKNNPSANTSPAAGNQHDNTDRPVYNGCLSAKARRADGRKGNLSYGKREKEKTAVWHRLSIEG